MTLLHRNSCVGNSAGTLASSLLCSHARPVQSRKEGSCRSARIATEFSKHHASLDSRSHIFPGITRISAEPNATFTEQAGSADDTLADAMAALLNYKPGRPLESELNEETLLEFEWAAPLRRLLIGSGRRAIFKKGTKHPTATLEAVLMDDPEYISRLVGKRNLAKVEKALSGPEVFLEDWPTTDADWPLTKDGLLRKIAPQMSKDGKFFIKGIHRGKFLTTVAKDHFPYLETRLGKDYAQEVVRLLDERSQPGKESEPDYVLSKDFVLSGWRAQKFLDGEGPDATKNAGIHKGKTLRAIAESDPLHLYWLVPWAYVETIMRALGLPYFTRDELLEQLKAVLGLA